MKKRFLGGMLTILFAFAFAFTGCKKNWNCIEFTATGDTLCKSDYCVVGIPGCNSSWNAYVDALGGDAVCD